MSDIIQLDISLHKSNPLIHRTVLVKKETSFFELHHIIQIVMGWQNYHLFEFNLDGYRIGVIEENQKNNGYGSDQIICANTTILSDILSSENDVFNYTYDLGDCWLHEISMSMVSSREGVTSYPVCVDGELNCPPEDCGGIIGFYNILTVILDNKHPEYKKTRKWVGKKYDPLIFNKDKINKQLKQLPEYIARWNLF
ncbi:plasmid pRiA4b ORF-3 family protein [soil metagenome]